MPDNSNNASALQNWIDEGKTLLATRDNIRWQLGEWWNKRSSIPELREMRADEIAEKFFEGRRLSTVQGYATVAKLFPSLRGMADRLAFADQPPAP